MDTRRINVNGGAITLGHSLGATGVKLTVQLVQELGWHGGGLGMVTMCIGGGMAASGVFDVTARYCLIRKIVCWVRTTALLE